MRSLVPAALVALVTVAGCDTSPGPSLYDPLVDGTYSAKPAPVLTRIEPGTDALAGLTTLTLVGQNFVVGRDSAFTMVDGRRVPALKDSTYVYFDGVRVPTLRVTPTTITVLAPNTPKTGIQVKVAVLGAPAFSETRTYALAAAVERFGAINRAERIASLTTDAAGTVYVSYLNATTSTTDGIVAFTPAGVRSTYAPVPAGTTTYNDLAFSQAAGGLFGVRNNRLVFKLDATGEAAFVDLRTQAGTGARFETIDDDDAGNLWVSGTNTRGLHRIAPDRTVTSVAFDAATRVVALEVRPGFVYVSAIVGGVNQIHRFPVSGATIGAPELVYNVEANHPGVTVTRLAFNSEGGLYMGTNRIADPILFLAPGAATASSYYPGLLRLDVVTGQTGTTRPDAPVSGLDWSTGSGLITGGVEILADPKSLETIGDLVRINTLKTAER